MTDQIIHLLEDQNQKLDRIDQHLVNLNGKVAKHSDWINRYDIRVAEEVPKLAEVASSAHANAKSIKTWVTGMGVGMTVIIVAIGLFVVK